MATRTAVANEETYLPTGDEQGTLVDLVEALQKSQRGINQQPCILDSEMNSHELTPQLADILVSIAGALAEGEAVTVISRRHLLTTQEAAEIIDVSRPTLIKILERGELAFEMRGRHRRVELGALLEYRRRVRAERTRMLAEMQRQSQADGLYNIEPLSVDDLVS